MRRPHAPIRAVGFLSNFLGWLWRGANFWRVSPIGEARTGSMLAGGLLFLVTLFFIIGLLLVMLGFDLDRVDQWLDAQGGWLDLVGKLLLRALLAFILLLCGATIVGWLFDRKNPDKPGWSMALGAAVVGWLCAATLFSPL